AGDGFAVRIWGCELAVEHQIVADVSIYLRLDRVDVEGCEGRGGLPVLRETASSQPLCWGVVVGVDVRSCTSGVLPFFVIRAFHGQTGTCRRTCICHSPQTDDTTRFYIDL
uniref:Uncharacterized protein n=1 Tax=Ciona savignyi TaxID=51511 RepID=H2YHW5_CIOSA